MPARSPAMRRTPSASSRTDTTPAACETRRACRTPTPNSSNEAYSRPVNTGAMKIGFHSSRRHAPKSALLRALWTHAPSSCQTMPTVVRHGGSALGNTPRSAAASATTQTSVQAKRRAEVEGGTGNRSVSDYSTRVARTTDGARTPDLTMVIPTYNERERIAELVESLGEVCDRSGVALELVVVDDN